MHTSPSTSDSYVTDSSRFQATPVSTSATGQGHTQAYTWLHRPDGRVFNNLTIPDTEQGRKELAQITGEALMEVAERAGGKVAIFDSKAQFYAFHETTVSQKHPALGSRDLIAEIIAAGKKRGILYVPYIPIDADERAFREHPEWRPIKVDGTPMDDSIGWPRLCQNSPFGEFMAQYVRELVQNYDIHGLWFDGVGLYQGPDYCYCTCCRDGFRAATGLEAPEVEGENLPVWRKWRAFRHGSVQRIMARIRQVAHEIKPGLPVLAGYGWHNALHNTESYFTVCDMVWNEASWMWPTSSLQYLRAATGRMPEFYIPSSVYAPSYALSLPEQELRSSAMESIANGAVPIFTLEGRVERLRPINEELAARAEWLCDAEPIPHCGLVFSARSMYATETSPYSESSHFASYGVLHALLQEHIAEQYLTDRDLDEGIPDDFASVVLSDIGYIPPKAADNLRKYVANGGGLVALWNTSLRGVDGEALPNFSLADLFGVNYVGTMPETTELPPWWGDITRSRTYPNVLKTKFLTWDRDAPHPIVDDPMIQEAPAIEVVPAYQRGKSAEYPLPYFGDMLKVSGFDVESVLWEGLQEPGTRWPLVTSRTYGKGRVVYIAGDLSLQQLALVTHSYVRRLLANAVRYVSASAGGGEQRLSPFHVTAPLHVVATIFRQAAENRVVLHLRNAPNPAGLPPYTRENWGGRFPTTVRAKEEVVPVHDIEVRLLGNYRSVYTAPDRKALHSYVEDGYIVVRVPRLDTHIMVVGEY